MKKLLIPALCLLLVLLCACGKAPEPATDASGAADASAAADESASAEAAEKESVTFDDGAFRYLKADLPKGWTINEIISTSTYLEASYGKGENAPRLTVSVMSQKDEMGAEKTQLLAEKVHEREADNATDVTKLKIGGLDFYSLSYNSLLTKGTRCYVFYGQTTPDKNNAYTFIEIQIDNLKDAKQYDTLKGVLDQLSFAS